MDKIKKHIGIIGAGISGLTLLHYLKRRYQSRTDVKISLYEKEAHAGGTIRTISKGTYLFETGPNGFLNSKPQTLKLIEELGLTNRMISASESANFRYLSIGGKLETIPTSPKQFLTSKLLTPLQKLRIAGEIFIPKGHNAFESVYDFGKRRLGEGFADMFLDPMVSGIYGGDAKKTILKQAFPRIYELEQTHGSLFKAMLDLKLKKRNEKATGMPKGSLTSFPFGMTELLDTLATTYREDIHFNHEVVDIFEKNGQFSALINGKTEHFSEVYCSLPAYQMAAVIRSMRQDVSDQLLTMKYAPIAVVGLVYPRTAFMAEPKGFGYLVPSKEKSNVLGVLFESNIFSGRAPEGKILFRVMLGGVRNPQIAEKSREELVELAVTEIKSMLQAKDECEDVFFAKWPKAIPQYDDTYLAIKEKIDRLLIQLPNLHVAANFYRGVSFNDCIEKSFEIAEKSIL